MLNTLNFFDKKTFTIVDNPKLKKEGELLTWKDVCQKKTLYKDGHAYEYWHFTDREPLTCAVNPAGSFICDEYADNTSYIEIYRNRVAYVKRNISITNEVLKKHVVEVDMFEPLHGYNYGATNSFYHWFETMCVFMGKFGFVDTCSEKAQLYEKEYELYLNGNCVPCKNYSSMRAMYNQFGCITFEEYMLGFKAFMLECHKVVEELFDETLTFSQQKEKLSFEARLNPDLYNKCRWYLSFAGKWNYKTKRYDNSEIVVTPHQIVLYDVVRYILTNKNKLGCYAKFDKVKNLELARKELAEERAILAEQKQLDLNEVKNSEHLNLINGIAQDIMDKNLSKFDLNTYSFGSIEIRQEVEAILIENSYWENRERNPHKQHKKHYDIEEVKNAVAELEEKKKNGIALTQVEKNKLCRYKKML